MTCVEKWMLVIFVCSVKLEVAANRFGVCVCLIRLMSLFACFMFNHYMFGFIVFVYCLSRIKGTFENEERYF